MSTHWDQEIVSFGMYPNDIHDIDWWEMNNNIIYICSFVVTGVTTLRELMRWVRIEFPVFNEGICLTVSRKFRYRHSVIYVIIFFIL